ncbi:kinase-like domain-containing protein, partial [Roridomyces roridus]
LVLKEDGKPEIHFRLGNRLGHGRRGPVYRALNLNTGQMMAVKRIQLEELQVEHAISLLREVDVVKRLSHPNIVNYESVVRDTDSLSIVMKYGDNDSLAQTLKAFGNFNELLAARYIIPILKGLHYLHSNDIVHGDIQVENILTNNLNGTVKLTGFGLAFNLPALDSEKANWMAPEIIELQSPPSTKSDIWSLGCTIIEMVTGHPPYCEIEDDLSVMFRIVDDETIPLPEGCSSSLRDLLTQCFNKDPAKRPDAELFSEHQWLQKNW